MRLECRNLNKIFSDEEKETRVISDISFEAQ